MAAYDYKRHGGKRMNLVILSGNIASDVKTATTGSGIQKTVFRLAVQRRFSG